MSTVVPVRLSTGELHTIREGDRLWVVFRPAVEDLGLSVETQVRKLNSRSWACTAERAVQLPGDAQTRMWKVVDRRTFTMWLATVNENNVPDQNRPVLVALQQEAADALDAYFHEGGAINPRATEDQLDILAARTRTQLEAIGVAKRYGLVNDSYLEGVSRTLLARMTGEEPQLDPADMTITCQEYVEDKGLTGKDIRSARTRLGSAVAALYRARYGCDPQKIKRPIDGVYRSVAVYTRRDIDLFHAAWADVSRRAS